MEESGMRFTLVSRYPDGDGGMIEEGSLDEIRDRIECLAPFIGGLVVGEVIEIKRIT
jgi:hypothetical protein